MRCAMFVPFPFELGELWHSNAKRIANTLEAGSASFCAGLADLFQEIAAVWIINLSCRTKWLSD